MLRYLWKSVFDPTLADDIRCPPSPSPSMRAALEADAGAAVDRVRRVLDIPHVRLLRVCQSFARTLDDAVAGRPSSLDARPSHLHQMPTGAETGTYLAMDLGTSLIHVACVSFFGGGLHEVQQVQHAIPEVIKSADADTFFNFLADVVEEALRESGGLMLSSMHLGVTWSFRLDQNALDDGTLVHWSKEFSVTGVEGRDVVRLLQKALDNRGLGIKVVAIINDSVSNLIAGAYSLPSPDLDDYTDDVMSMDMFNAPCLASCIMGSGTNAAYLERTSRVAASLGVYRSFTVQPSHSDNMVSIPFSPAYPTNGFGYMASTNDSFTDGDNDNDNSKERKQKQTPELTIINTEWGDLRGIPLTPWDEPTPPSYHQHRSISSQRSASTNSTLSLLHVRDNTRGGKRIFERMVGAPYLGRIIGRIVTTLISNGELFCRLIEALPNMSVVFTIDELITIESDDTEKLVHVGDVVGRLFRLNPTDVCVVDRLLLQQITRLVSDRAARLHAAAIAALVAQLHRSGTVRLKGFPSGLFESSVVSSFNSDMNGDKDIEDDSSDIAEDDDNDVEYDSSDEIIADTVIVENDTVDNTLDVMNTESSIDTPQVSVDDQRWSAINVSSSAVAMTDRISICSVDSSESNGDSIKASPLASTAGDSQTLVSSPKASWTWTSNNLPTVQLTLSESATPVAAHIYPTGTIPDSLAKAFRQLMTKSLVASTKNSSSNTGNPSQEMKSPLLTDNLSSLFHDTTTTTTTASELSSSPKFTASPQELHRPFDYPTTPPDIKVNSMAVDAIQQHTDNEMTAKSPPVSSSSTIVPPSSIDAELKRDKRNRPPPISTGSTESYRTYVGTPTLSSLSNSLYASTTTAATTAVTTPEERPLRSRASYTRRPSYISSPTVLDMTPIDKACTTTTTTTTTEDTHPLWRSSINSIASMTDAYTSVTIVVDGLMFRHYPHYSVRVYEALRELVGVDVASAIHLIPTHESAGCIGAALAALLSTTRRP